MPDGPNPATRFATAFLARLVANGVRHLVVAPGSRSQALALAAAELEAAGRVRLHVRIDERVAGFLALGLALGGDAPVAVIVTSGTAVAELHPAMLEAWHSGVPLIAITADRPEELRGIAANQATEQRGIFGPAAVWSADVAAPDNLDDPRAGDPQAGDQQAGFALADQVSAAVVRGPAHVNVAFRDPLSGPAALVEVAAREPRPERARSAEPVGEVRRAVVIAGSGAGPGAEEYARAARLPLLAEVTSGARYGPNLVPAYRAVLGDPGFADRVRRVVVFGRPNLSREVPALLTRPDVESIVVAAPGAQQFDPARTARIVDALLPPETPGDEDWLREWVAAGRRALVSDDVPYAGEASAPGRTARAELAALRAPITRRALAEAVWRATWPHDRLVLAASRLVREADKAVPGKRIRVHANRGLAGIDGTIATAWGVAAAGDDVRSAAGTTRVLLGDLALLHDAGALLVPPDEPRRRVQLVVGNDGGGTIFDDLEVKSTAARERFDRVLYTPHDVHLASLAAAYSWQHTTVTTRGDLDRALTSPPPGPSILEVPLVR